MSNPITFYYTNVLTSLFIEQTSADNPGGPGSGPGIRFQDIGNAGDWWAMMNGPIVDGLYWEDWYNREAVSDGNYIYYENKMLGVPRLRQLRVAPGTCKVYSLFQNSIPDCYDAYTIFNEDKTPYGIYNANTTQDQMNDTA